MNKRELTARVQRHMGAGASRRAAQAAVNAVLESILQTAAEESKVHLAHLGTFEYRTSRRRSGQGLPGTTPSPPRNIRHLRFRQANRLKERITQTCPPQAEPTTQAPLHP